MFKLYTLNSPISADALIELILKNQFTSENGFGFELISHDRNEVSFEFVEQICYSVTELNDEFQSVSAKKYTEIRQTFLLTQNGSFVLAINPSEKMKYIYELTSSSLFHDYGLIPYNIDLSIFISKLRDILPIECTRITLNNIQRFCDNGRPTPYIEKITMESNQDIYPAYLKRYSNVAHKMDAISFKCNYGSVSMSRTGRFKAKKTLLNTIFIAIKNLP